MNFRFLASVALLTAILTACADDQSDNDFPDQVKPSQSLEQVEVKIYFASDTGKSIRLFSEEALVVNELNNPALAAVNALLSGAIPKDLDYVNLWEQGVTINNLSIDGTSATIDIKNPKLNVGSEAELRAIEQIIWTLKANSPGVLEVQFLIDGMKAETFAGHVDISNPVVIDQGYTSLATVDLGFDEGQEFSGQVRVAGLACTFEANVPWELTQQNNLISAGAQSAKMACPDRSEFEIDLGELPPGTYVLRVWESSMEDGSLVNQDTKTFMVK